MLLWILLFWIAVSFAIVGWKWWRASRLISSGGLNLIELQRMLKIAEKSKRMEAALFMRTRILGDAQKSEMQELGARIDPVIRELTRQVELQPRPGLEEAGDRIIRELQDLHAALKDGGDVQAKLARLEEAAKKLTTARSG